MIEELLTASRAELALAMARGHPLDPADLAGHEYRGISLGLPAWVDRLAWKTFVKAFFQEPDSGLVRGWNMRLEQTGVHGPLQPQTKHGQPVTFGHFAVCSEPGGGLVLDYGRGGNPWYGLTGLVRDPLVALAPGSTELLLGRSLLELGLGRLGTPSYFLLQRERPLTHVATAGAGAR